MWKEDPNGKKEDYWIDLIYQEDWEEGDNHYWHATVKSDGCIHLDHAGNEPFNKFQNAGSANRPENSADDYIHICNIDEVIDKLTKLKEAAIKHFGENWNK